MASLVKDTDGDEVVVLTKAPFRRIATHLPPAVSGYTICRVQIASRELQPIDDTYSNIVGCGAWTFRPEKYLGLWSWSFDPSPAHPGPNTIAKQDYLTSLSSLARRWMRSPTIEGSRSGLVEKRRGLCSML